VSRGHAGAAVLATVALAIVAVACRSPRPDVGSALDSCVEGGPPLTPGSAAKGLAGSYRLSLTAESGLRTGTSAEGRLALLSRGDSAAAPVVVLGVPDSSVTHPLAGTLELDPAAVGAVATGDLQSTDPAAPGVLVIERRRADAPVEITLRLGADANRGGKERFDGGYFALTVRRLGPKGFAGTWASGGAIVPSGSGGARGTFCARRTSS
jgi:hypothetical protein